MGTKPTKTELAADLEQAREEIAHLREALKSAALSEDAITDCRAMLVEVGIHRTYFDDAVAEAVRELKAHRYDLERYRRMTAGIWSSEPGQETLRPKRDGSEPKAFTAAVSWALAS